MKKMISWLLDPPIFGPAAILWIRLLAGGVFFWEGILKFVYPNQGTGRFTKLGFPLPELTAHFIATTEIIGGLLLLAGGTSPLPLPPAPPKTGFWAVLHEIRSDYAQLLSCVFLLLEGPGLRSLDRLRKKR
jgi:putative oxidoreductase